MEFTVNTPGQLRSVLRALRKSRGLSQAELGTRLGVNQKRVARIEAKPEVTSFDQISRYASSLGAQFVLHVPGAPKAKPSKPDRKGAW